MNFIFCLKKNHSMEMTQFHLRLIIQLFCLDLEIYVHKLMRYYKYKYNILYKAFPQKKIVTTFYLSFSRLFQFVFTFS